MIPMYNTMIFTQVWDNVEDFLGDVKANPLHTLKEESLNKLFYLLYAQYGNSPIANNDVEQFKFKIYSVIYKYGPTWEKRIEVQEKIRNLNEDEIRTGTKQIFNRADNPSTDPSTCTLEEINYINSQNTANLKRSKLEGYEMLLNLLESDVTEEFLNKFRICFKQFVMPENTVLYDSEGE